MFLSIVIEWYKRISASKPPISLKIRSVSGTKTKEIASKGGSHFAIRNLFFISETTFCTGTFPSSLKIPTQKKKDWIIKS